MFQEPRDAAKRAGLTQAGIAAAGKLVEQALHRRGYEYYSDEELGVLAILVAYHSYQQRARGKKGREAAKEQAKEPLINLRIMAHCAFDSRATVWTGS